MRRRHSRSQRIRKGPLDSEMEPTDQGEKLPRIDVCRLYLFFLSARRLHFPAADYLVLATSVGLFMLSMITGTSYATAVIAFVPGTVHPHMRHERGFLLQESTFSFSLRRAR